MLDLVIKNFRALKNVSLSIEGLVWITGPNDNGKSCLIKAINTVMINASGDKFIRIGEDNTEINLLFSKTKSFPALDIQWSKNRKGSGTYIINGTKLVKTGRTTPQEILDSGLAFLRLRDRSFNLHIWDQATYFLVREPTTVIFQAVSKLLKHQAFLPMLQQVKIDIKEQKDNLNDLGSQFKYLQKRKIDFAQQLDYFQPFDIKRESFELLFDLHGNREQSQQDLNFLRSLNGDIKKNKEKLQNIQPILKTASTLLSSVTEKANVLSEYHDWLEELEAIQHQIDSVDQTAINMQLDSIPVVNPKKLAEFLELTKLVQEMRLLIREEKRCQEKVDNLPADVVNTFKTLQPLFWVYNSSRVMLDELTSIEDEVIQGTDRLTSVTTRLEQAEEERKIFYSDNPLCPLCGNAWDGKECTDGS